MLQERAENIKSFDGNELFFSVYAVKKKTAAESKIDGVVLAVHGLGA